MTEFPIFKTKIPNDTKTFSLEDPEHRRAYFLHKAQPEIEFIKDYLKSGTFVAFLLGKKNSGKGTYSKLFMEAVGKERVAHLSVGDIVRAAHHEAEDESTQGALVEFLKKRYRGPVSVPKVIDIIVGRDTVTLLPTEVILALVEREIDRVGRKAVFIDGFPRSLDQVSLSLYLRALMGYRDDPDFFVFLNVANSVIDERIKNRVICPICKTPRSLKLLRTKEAGYDEIKKEFYLKCDNPECSGARMVPKEGDELGIAPIKDRIMMDDKISDTLVQMEGIQKILLRNVIPAVTALDYVDQYELTPAYKYAWDEATKTVNISEEPWTVKDDNGVESNSLLPAGVVLGLIKNTARVLGFESK